MLGGGATKASKETATPQMGSRSSARHQGGAMRVGKRPRFHVFYSSRVTVGGVKVRMAGKDGPAYSSRSFKLQLFLPSFGLPSLTCLRDYVNNQSVAR